MIRVQRVLFGRTGRIFDYVLPIFPDRPKPLRVGESVTVPLDVPFDAMNSVLSVEGTSTITLTGYVTIDGRRCARIETDIDMSKLDIPEEMPGTYKCAFKGKSVSYFDVEKSRFVSVEVALAIGMQIEAPMPKVDMGGEELPDKMEMSMQVDTLIRLTPNPEKAKAEAKK